MRFGVSLPPFRDFADPLFLANAARDAETAGWDGFFIWDHVFFDPSFYPNIDPWVGLSAIAMQTSRLRIGAMITPLARRRPWIMARQTVSVDRLSNGRLIFGAGLGDPAQWDFGFFHEETDPKRRAVVLDEGLEIMTRLWTGEFVKYTGTHFQLEEMRFLPKPLQTPRIPIWIGGNYPNKAPMRRAARWDGFHPIKEDGMTPDDWRETLAYIRQHRTIDTPFDAVHGGRVPEDQWTQAESLVQLYADAGVTWWVEDVSPWRFGLGWEDPWTDTQTSQMLDFIRRGPPKL
jgi:alkanesulfonate monooxygenase SsuD/methylene tetrahydromethanopterin reductase-like flavin-dependent oxidoreductase (luciferase family)